MANKVAKKKQDKPLNNGEKKVLRDEGGKFLPGSVPNPAGRPPGTKNYLTRLEEALERYRKDHDKDLFDRFIERAFRSDKVLIAALKKFVPDMEKTEFTGNINQNIDMSGLTTEELKKLAYDEIDNKSKKRNSETGKNRTGPT